MAFIVSIAIYNAQLGKVRLTVFSLLAFGIMFVLIIISKWLLKLKSQLLDNNQLIEKSSTCQQEQINSLCKENDFYIKNTKSINDLLEYEILNADKEVVWNCRCKLAQEIIHSIEMCTSDKVESILKVIYNPVKQLYWVIDGQLSIGTIRKDSEGWHYNNVDDQLIYSAIIKEKDEEEEDFNKAVNLIGVFTPLYFTSPTPRRRLVDFILHGNKDEVIGQYFFSLSNIDLTSDIDRKFDRRIAVIFSILLDVQFIQKL